MNTFEIVEIEGGFKVPQDSHIGKWQIEAKRLEHDTHLPLLVCSELEFGNVVLDLGGFNGDHSIAYSNAVGDRGIVVAVEAGKVAFECLKHNIGLFPHKNTYALHAAIGEKDGDSVSHEPNENLGASLCSIVPPEERKAGSSYLLTVTIDYLRNQLDKPINFIKLDIEGWEVKALLGASKTLKNDQPGLLIEVNQAALEANGDSEEDIFDILEFHGYSWTIAQPQASVGDPQYDLLCFPKVKDTPISVPVRSRRVYLPNGTSKDVSN